MNLAFLVLLRASASCVLPAPCKHDSSVFALLPGRRWTSPLTVAMRSGQGRRAIWVWISELLWAMGLEQTHFLCLGLSFLAIMKPVEEIIFSLNIHDSEGRLRSPPECLHVLLHYLFNPCIHSPLRVAWSFLDATGLSKFLWWVLEILLHGPNFTHSFFWIPLSASCLFIANVILSLWDLSCENPKVI